MDNKFYSDTQNVENPYKFYGLTLIIVSALTLLLAIEKISELKNSIVAIFQNKYYGNFPISTLLSIITILIAIYWVVWGVRNLISGIKDQGRMVLSPQYPVDHKSINEIKSALKKRYLSIYSISKKGPLSIARKYFSNKIQYLTSTTKTIVSQSIQTILNILKLIIVIGLVSFFSELIRVKLSEIIYVNDSFLSFPIYFVIILVIAAIIDVGSILYLIPQSSPIADVDENIYSIKGAGDPFVFNSEVEESLTQIRNRNIPNRITKDGFLEEASSIENTGKFQGNILVENQPEYVPFNIPKVAYFYLVLGGFFLLAGVYTLLYQLPQNIAMDNSIAIDIANIIWVILKGLTYSGLGVGFLKKAHLLFGTFRFESILILLEIEGTLGTSEIKAGKAIHDSFESKNTVIRSDFQVKQYIAKTLTETYTLDGNRYIIGMIIDDEALQAKDILQKAILTFRDSGVSIRGIDLSSPSVSDMAKANIMYQQNARLDKSQFDKNEYDRQLKENQSKMLGENKTDEDKEDKNK